MLQTRPLEAICISSIDKNHETLKILNNSNLPPSMSFISQKDILQKNLNNILVLYFG